MEIYQNDYNEKQEEEAKIIGYTAWLNGTYIIHAIQTAFNPKKAKYPKPPSAVDNDSKDGKNTEETQKYTQAEIEARRFEDWASVFNRKFKQQNNDST